MPPPHAAGGKHREVFAGGYPKGVEPHVELQAPAVRLFEHKGQGIVPRGAVAGSREELAPGFGFRDIKGIRLRPHLHDHRIHPAGDQRIEYPDVFPLLLFDGQACPRRPVDPRQGGDPRCTEFPFRDKILSRDIPRPQQTHQQPNDPPYLPPSFHLQAKIRRSPRCLQPSPALFSRSPATLTFRYISII